MKGKKEVSNTNAVAKKPRGKPFAKGADERRTGQFTSDDPRRNTNGQRNREVVQTAAQARDLYVQVLHEPINTPVDPQMSNLEMIVRQHVKSAKGGDAQAREQMFDRIWGKAAQPVDLTSSDGSMTPQAIMFVPFNNSANNKTDVSANPDNS